MKRKHTIFIFTPGKIPSFNVVEPQEICLILIFEWSHTDISLFCGSHQSGVDWVRKTQLINVQSMNCLQHEYNCNEVQFFRIDIQMISNSFSVVRDGSFNVARFFYTHEHKLWCDCFWRPLSHLSPGLSNIRNDRHQKEPLPLCAFVWA